MITSNSKNKIIDFYNTFTEATTVKQKKEIPCDLSWKQTNGYAFFISLSIISKTKFIIELCATKYTGKIDGSKFADAVDNGIFVDYETSRKKCGDDILLAIKQLNDLMDKKDD